MNSEETTDEIVFKKERRSKYLNSWTEIGKRCMARNEITEDIEKEKTGK